MCIRMKQMIRALEPKVSLIARHVATANGVEQDTINVVHKVQ